MCLKKLLFSDEEIKMKFDNFTGFEIQENFENLKFHKISAKGFQIIF